MSGLDGIKDYCKNHTIIGRMSQGDSLPEAIKNDFMEDTTIGQLLQGKSLNDAIKTTKSPFAGLVALGAGEIVGQALGSVFTQSDE